MNKRWAWTMPVLLTLATTLVAEAARAQGGADPATLAAIQAQYAQMAAAQQAAYPIAAPQGITPSGTSPSGKPTITAFVPAAYAPAGTYSAPAMNPWGIQQAAYMAPMPAGEGIQPQMPGQFPIAPTPDVNGSYGYAPPGMATPGYGPQAYGPQGYGGGGMPMAPLYDESGYGGPMYEGQTGMDGACPYCGGQGCDQCGGMFGHGGLFHHGDGTHLPNGLLGDVLGLVAPYPDGGCAAVRWFDFAVDYMMLKRDNTGRNVDIASFGITGPIALSTSDLDFGSYRPGFRFTGAMQIGPANSVEFTYFGQFHYDAGAVVRSPGGNLFSALTNFGVIGTALGPVAEVDRANFNQILYTSTFDSFEINCRKRWMAPNCRYQGSWTLGVRHFILDEKFRLNTVSGPNGFFDSTGFEPARSRIDIDTTNNLTGLQIGTDMWICLLPGLRAGGEFQAGVYGNHMNINTTIGTNLPGLGNAIDPERLQHNDVSFIGQVNLLATYRINYQWTLRGGYTFLYVDGVALAPENFNASAPAIFNPFAPRTPLVNDNGNVFYHGWNVGLEFMW
jgi:Putative beta barrel porin-7 (BBP7)